MIETENVEINVAVSACHYWNALEIYYRHPNAINKQVLLQEDEFGVILKSSMDRFQCYHLYESFHSKLSTGCSLHAECASINPNFEIVKPELINEVYMNGTGMYLFIRRLVPKLYKDDNTRFYEYIFLDKSYMKTYIFTGSTASDYSINSIESEKRDPFAILKFDFIQLHWSSDCINLGYNKNVNVKGVNWIMVTFVNRFTKLLLNDSHNKFEYKNQVDVVEYYKLYEKLKKKYAKVLIENWTEATDPEKFVHEDIGIATYLILLWSADKIKKGGAKKFVDLGCGNGLLVHILNSEGHRGIGLDIRRRKIWDFYPSTTVLKEEAVIPTKDAAFPEADWLIGNHSDELTAWLPIMARRSNRLCQYFVLPCCPYELNGKKFQRKNSGVSTYRDFINYVEGISNLCQFETRVDRLRIPSTKRICLVGFNEEAKTEEQWVVISRNIDGLLKACASDDVGEDARGLGFAPRGAVEPVRNCTRVPRNARESILKCVMNELLKENVLCVVAKDGKPCFWNRGGKVSIASLAGTIDANLLKQLKSECKGLQTLLKNNHFLFEISRGCVQLRAPKSMLEICKKALDGDVKWKSKSCWFFRNHPDGCALSDDVCSYAHFK